jgi:hypothetical protein
MGGFNERGRALVLLLGVGVLVVAAGSAIGAAKRTVATSGAGRSITAVRTASDATRFQTNSGTYVDVPGATATISIPAGATGLILIQFTASSICDQQDNLSCMVRAEINGTDAPPGQIVWDRVPSGGTNKIPLSAHAMDWSAGPLGPGSYTVQIQALGQLNSGGAFVLQGWHLTVERVKV